MTNSNVIEFQPKPKKEYKQWNEAIAGIMADPFFAPFVEAYGDDFGRGYLIRENGHCDLGYCDDREFPLNLRLTALSVHFDNLEGDCEEDEWINEIALKIDKDPEAFIERFWVHYAGDHPVLKEMLLFALEAGGTFGAWRLMVWVLRWSEAKAGRPLEVTET